MKRRYRFQFEIQTIHVSDTENVVMTKIWNEDNDGDIRNSCLQLHCSILVDIKHDLCTLYQRWSRAFYSWHHIVGFFSLIFGPHTSVCLSHFLEQSNVNLKKKKFQRFFIGIYHIFSTITVFRTGSDWDFDVWLGLELGALLMQHAILPILVIGDYNLLGGPLLSRGAIMRPQIPFCLVVWAVPVQAIPQF